MLEGSCHNTREEAFPGGMGAREESEDGVSRSALLGTNKEGECHMQPVLPEASSVLKSSSFPCRSPESQQSGRVKSQSGGLVWTVILEG